MASAALASPGELYFNPFDEAFRANPYPYYKALLEGPPRLVPLFFNTGLVARYEHVTAILRDHERFSSRLPMVPALQASDPFAGAPTMLTSDPPVQSRLRRLVSRAFTPRRVTAMEPRIRQITGRLLDRVEAHGRFEVIEDLANPLPVMVIAEMLGVPSEHYETFKQLSDTIITRDNVPPGMPLSEEVVQATRDLREYFAKVIETRRLNPGDDLVSALVAAHADSEALSEEELLAFVVLLLLAGNETTTNLIGNAMLALGEHPDQLDRLRREPALIDSAVEEVLRYDGPVQATMRFTRMPVEVGSVELPEGIPVMVVLAAANRDPRQFPEPERFDIGRTPNDHVAFGEGIHFCLGAPLARLEGTVAIGMALERFPRLRVPPAAAPRRYKGSFILRGLAELPATID